MNKVKLSDVISPHFRRFWVASREKKHLKYVMKGGRGSGKSFHIGLRVVQDIIEFPVSALVMRKVQNTIRKSVFQQIKVAAKALGVEHLFRFVPSTLEITYKPRGNKIYFAGADNPDKIKSIVDGDYPVAILWIEELAEFKTEEEVSTIEKSILRKELDGLIHSEAQRKQQHKFDYSFYYSYNPPKRKQSWVNKEFDTANLPDNVFVDHSTYLDNPHLSKQFVKEAEETKKKKPLKYDWEYMGKAIGSGVVPFNNLEFRTITDEEIRTFDNIKQGIDWGYGVDPVSFTRWHYDKTRRIMYLMDEYYGVKIPNRELAEWMKKKGYHTTRTIADSAEPKSIDEMKTYGINIKGAKKGPGSVEYGEKWLDDEIEKIVIDFKRTPHTAKEFEDIDYKTDADGNPRAKLEETNNHSMGLVA